MDTSSVKKKWPIIIRLLVVFGVLLVVAISITGYFLKRGITIDSLTIGPTVVSDCSLVWLSKLELQIGQITVNKKEKSKVEKSEQTDPDLSFVRRGIQAGYYLSVLFSRFNIEKVSIGENSFAVDLNQTTSKTYLLLLTSETVTFRSLLTFTKETMDIDIVEAKFSKFNSELRGKVQFYGTNNRATGAISALINGSFPVSLNFIADDHQISFQGSEAGEITEIKSLVDLFGLRHGIQRWITDYLSGSRYHLKSFKGTLPWKDPKKILDTLEAEVRVDDTEYTFAPGLQPIKGRYTEVFFEKGVLIIKPHEATFYGQDGGESWLDINFNDLKNILLTAYIKTRAVANDDILTLLKYYKIPLPFKQVGGKTATDLRLAITLNKKKFEAQGVFEIDDGIIEWGGKNYRAQDARIELANSDVTIKQLKASYGEMLTAQVSGFIQARKKMGDLDILLEQVDVKAGKSLLNIDTSVPAHLQYHFEPGQQILEAQPTSWLLDSWKLNVGAFRAPIRLDEMTIEIPPVSLDTPPGISSEVSGYYSFKKKQAKFICDLLEYHVKDLQLKSPHMAIAIEYDNGFVFKTGETAVWELSKMGLTLSPSEFRYRDETFTITNSRISYGSFFDSYLSGYYSWEDKKGAFSLKKIDITNEKLQQKLDMGKSADVEVSGAGGKFVIYFPIFDLTIRSDEQKNWSAVFNDLSKTYNYSKIQQLYKINNGSLTVSSTNGKRPYQFSADIIAPYPLIVEGGIPTDTLKIAGRIADEGVFATVNDDLNISYIDKALTINSEKLGYNINAVIQLFRDLPKSKQSTTATNEGSAKPFIVKLKADDSQVYLSPQSRILAGTINLEYMNGKLLMELLHGPGKILLQLEKGNFLLNGSDLNDEFMGALIQSSEFSGGRMSMGAIGSFEEFSVVFDIKETVLNQLATVNNIMAFLDTVPALATFSLPSYHATGLPIHSAVVGMKFKKKIGTLESLEVLSPELQGKGKGKIDFVKRRIDMDIQLTTQAGKNMSKVPVIGYILAGDEEEESLSLQIKGSFDNPEVSNSLLKEIVVYPLELLYRTLNLPFHLIKKLDNQPKEQDAVSGESALENPEQKNSGQNQ